MSGICLPIDASAGSPAFPAAQHRAAQSALMASTSGRPLGARSGIRPGSLPSVSLAGSNWTLTPFSAIGDPGTGLAVGPYLVGFLANETGTLNPADGTNPRIDRLDVQVPDDPPGASPRNAVIVYTAGVAAATPSAAAAPPRSFPLGTFTVPSSSSGSSPSWSPAFRLTVAAGGILPVVNAADYPSAPYVDQYVSDAALGLLRWDGTKWAPPGRLRAQFVQTTATTGIGAYKILANLSAAPANGGVLNFPGLGNSAGVITIPAGFDGAYLLSGQVTLATVAGMTGMAGAIFQNGNIIHGGETVSTGGGNPGLQTATLAPREFTLAGNDTLSLEAFSFGAATSSYVDANRNYNSWLRLEKIG